MRGVDLLFETNGRKFPPMTTYRWMKKQKPYGGLSPVYQLFVYDGSSFIQYPIAQITKTQTNVWGVKYHMERSPRGLGYFKVGWKTLTTAKKDVESLYGLNKSHELK